MYSSTHRLSVRINTYSSAKVGWWWSYSCFTLYLSMQPYSFCIFNAEVCGVVWIRMRIEIGISLMHWIIMRLILNGHRFRLCRLVSVLLAFSSQPKSVETWTAWITKSLASSSSKESFSFSLCLHLEIRGGNLLNLSRGNGHFSDWFK